MECMQTMPAASRLPEVAAARRYAATQPFIVDKTPFFERLADEIADGPVVELGVGPGGFLAWASGRTEARLIGCDASPGMISLARAAAPRAEWHAEVDLLDVDAPFYKNLPRARLIVLSQAEHYAPNGAASPLAARLVAAGRPATAKPALRRHLALLLAPGGVLAVIDDFRADDAGTDAEWTSAWDAHVVRQFADPAVVAAVGSTDPAAAAHLRKHYAATRPESERLQLARRARERRRVRQWEETQRWSEAQADFAAVFGEGNVWCMRHPSGATHPSFFMLCGRRVSE